MNQEIIKTVGAAVVMTAVVVAVLNPVLGVSLELSTVFDQPATVETVGGTGTIDTNDARIIGLNMSTTSLEDGIKLTGDSNSEVEGSFDADIRGDWSFCTWGAAESSVVSNNEKRSMAGYDDIVLSYNGTGDRYEVWYYNDSSKNSYLATVPAPSPTNDTLVCGIHNNSELTAFRNTTAGTSTSTTGDNTASSPPSANWNGTLDETRLWNYSLSGAQLNSFYTEPVLSIDGPAPAARLMYDVRDPGSTSVPVHFTGESASLSNTQFVDGFDAVPATAGTDYTLSGFYNNTVNPTDTGVVDGDGTVLFIDYTARGGTLLFHLINIGTGALQLLVVGLLVLAGSKVFDQLGGGY